MYLNKESKKSFRIQSKSVLDALVENKVTIYADAGEKK